MECLLIAAPPRGAVFLYVDSVHLKSDLPDNGWKDCRKSIIIPENNRITAKCEEL